jgi:HlyD family secretion protein
MLAALLLATGCDRFKKPVPVEFKTEAAVRTNMVQSVSANGGIAPIRQVQVGSQISGTITEMKVDFNSIVKEGDVLAHIDPATYERALARAKADLANATAGQAMAEFNSKRAKELFAAKLISETENQQADVALLQAQAGVKTREAAVESAQVDLDRTTIFAPISGVVVTRSVDAGQTVAASFSTPTLFLIAQDLAQMQIELAVSEADIGNVQEQQRVEFTVDAFPNRKFDGRVRQVRFAPTTNQNVVTYTTVVAVNNKDLRLRPGMTATASIVADERRDALLVPNAALRFTPTSAAAAAKKGLAAGMNLGPPKTESQRKGAAESASTAGARQVWVLPEGKAGTAPVAVAVTPGISDGRMTEITSGALQVGMRVVTAQKSAAAP